MKTDNYTFLTQGPIPRVIGTMAVPTIISMLITSLYNIADTFFVGHINTQSTAAIGVVFTVMFLMQAVGFFFGHGSGNYIARELGAKRHDNARTMASQGFFCAFFAGCLVCVAGLLLLRPIASALGSTPTILPYTERYMGIILCGAPFFMSSLTLNNQLRLQGNARYAMVGIVAGALLNVVLDPLLIFTAGMGITGAALATVIGQVVSFCILFAMTYHGGNIPIRWTDFRFSLGGLKEIFYGGSPSFSRQGLEAISTMMLNLAAANYGDAAIAGMSVVNRVCMLIMAVIIGLGQGFQPVCGFCYGAHLYKRLKTGFWFTVRLGTVFLLVCTLGGFAFTDTIIAIFRNDPAVIAIGSTALRWQLATLPFGATIMISNMMMQTCRKPWRANLLAAARRGIFFIPLVIILPACFGLQGVEMCQAWSDTLAFVFTVWVMYGAFKEFSREEAALQQTETNQ